MKISDMRESKFLKQSDVGTGALLTVKGIEQHNVAKEGADPELKYCISFLESEKPLVANSTNLQLCASIFGSDDTDDWTGKKIVLYTDPNVSFGGKLVGGLRLRKAKNQVARGAPEKIAEVAAKQMAKHTPSAIEELEDDIPS